MSATLAGLAVLSIFGSTSADPTERLEFSPMGAEENYKDDYRRNKYLAIMEVHCQQTSQKCPSVVAGALIHKHWVVTQAFENHELVLYFMIHLGISNTNNFLSEHTTAEYYMHPRSHPLPVNNLMLIKLQRPAILIDDAIEPIPLPPRTDFGLHPRFFTLAVHGMAENGPAITVENFHVVDNKLCTELLPLVNEDHYFGQFCAMPTSGKSCKAMLGAPAVWGPVHRPVLLGVQSRPDSKCEKHGVAVFTNIAMYSPWIEKTIGSDLREPKQRAGS